MRKIFVSIISVFVYISILSGCGKTSLITGNDAFDAGILSEGCFNTIFVDTSFISGDYYISDSSIFSDGYDYILSEFGYRSGTSKDYFLKFDKDGNSLYFSEIEKPIYYENGEIVTSNIASSIKDDFLTDYLEADVSYSDISFDSNEKITAYCEVIFYVYSELLNNTYSVNHDYLVTWNSDCKCVSIEECEFIPGYTPTQYLGYELGYDGNKYRLTSSGLILLDQEGKYSSKYFDFINSGILSYGFDSVNILDADHFSGVYMDDNFDSVLCIFVRNKNAISGIKPIVIASNELTIDLKRDVIAYNSQENGFRITVNDFSDRSDDSDPYEGWSILKDEITSGYKPDIILDTCGYDEDFIDKLSVSNELCDLKDVIFKDDDLGKVKFIDRAKALYYSGEKIYSVVPSFTYRTVIGSSEKWTGDEVKNYSNFISNTSDIAKTSNIFRDDTSEKFLKRLLSYNGYEYVDYTNRTSSFNSDSFIGYLELASYLPEDLDSAFERSYDYENNRYLFDISCENVGDFNLYSTINCLGDFKDIGFPGAELSGHGIISANESYMIVSGRKYTNECWDFIKCYLTEDYQRGIYTGVPVTESGYIVWKASVYPYTADYLVTTYFKDGEVRTVDNISEDRLNALLDTIKSCNYKEFSDYRIQQIVLENARLYFEGQMTAQQAASAIDTAVEAYLAS